MYVCICNAVCDKRIKEAITAGHADADAVYAHCGVEPRCRSCSETIEDMIASHAPRPAMPMAAD
jgi:bacterioferritin-associated ferredoxin